MYRPRTSVKGQILADFLVEKPDEAPPDTSVVETPQEPWTLFTDGSSFADGSGAGLILTSPEGTKFTYVQRFQFTASNNEAEYEALIAGLQIAAQMGVHNLHVSVDSKLVLVEVLKEKSIQEKEVAIVVEEEGPTWMTPIVEYLRDGTLPDDKKEASKLRIKARQYELVEGVLYRRSFLTLWLRYVGTFQAAYVIREIHERSCSMHAGPRSVVAKAMRLGYYWPTMHRDTREMIRACNDCQVHRPVPRDLQHPLTLIMAPWPFYKWGIDIAGPFWRAQESHGDTPLSLNYGTKAVILAEIGMPTYRTAVVDAVHNDKELRLNLDLLEERRECTAIHEAKAKLKMTKYYNAKVRGVTFRPGDFVYHSNEASHAMDGGKLGPKWEGPYEVTEVKNLIICLSCSGATTLTAMDSASFYYVYLKTLGYKTSTPKEHVSDKDLDLSSLGDASDISVCVAASTSRIARPWGATVGTDTRMPIDPRRGLAVTTPWDQGSLGSRTSGHAGDPQASYWLKYVHMIQGLDQELVIIGRSGLKQWERPEDPELSLHTY
ncbi:reverse transcriptase domain-containing protein [Tanacetum coccineum]